MRLTAKLIKLIDLNNIPEQFPETRKFMEYAKKQVAEGLYYLTLPTPPGMIEDLARYAGLTMEQVIDEDFRSMLQGGKEFFTCQHCSESVELEITTIDLVRCGVCPKCKGVCR